MKILGVKCDEDGCGWVGEKEDPNAWVKRPCPKCGNEIGLLKVLEGLEIMSKAANPNGGVTKMIRVDVGPMRKGLPPKVSLESSGEEGGEEEISGLTTV
jgi:hypothetical protein